MNRNKEKNPIKITEDLINIVNKTYFEWKALNNTLKVYATRGINFPETISEPIACYCLDLLWNIGASSSGDATNRNGHKIEIKATSNFYSDLTSFGPHCDFHNLIFLRLDYENDIVYIYDTQIDAEKLKIFSVNKISTVGDFQKVGKRPRFSVIKNIIEKEDLKPVCIYDLKNKIIKY